jgi:hypothetical protein
LLWNGIASPVTEKAEVRPFEGGSRDDIHGTEIIINKTVGEEFWWKFLHQFGDFMR